MPLHVLECLWQTHGAGTPVSCSLIQNVHDHGSCCNATLVHHTRHALDSHPSLYWVSVVGLADVHIQIYLGDLLFQTKLWS